MKIEEISVTTLKSKLDTVPDSFVLLDVREAHEKQIADLGGMHIPMSEWLDTWEAKLSNSKDKEIYVYCRSGARSLQVCMFLKNQGYKPYNVRGGILSWASTIDSGMNSY
jgi:rhodanese-related sulfurtransferase